MAKHKDIDDAPTTRQRWWDTYNAAIGGMLSADSLRFGLTGIHDRAVKIANIAHGPAVEPFTPVTPAPETP